MMILSPLSLRHAARLVCLPSLAVLLFAGCAEKDPKSPKFIVAKGEGVTVTRGELDAEETNFLAQRGINFSQVPPAQIPRLERQICEQMVMEQLLLKKAAGLKLPDLGKEVDAFVAKARSQFKTEAEFEAELAKSKLTVDKLKSEYKKSLELREVFKASIPEPKEPTFADVEKFYKENEAKFSQPDMVRASHILVLVPPGSTPAVKAEKKKVIDAARARVAKGEDFAKVAMEVSEDRGSAAQGGDLGLFRKGEMTPDFEKVAFGGKPGAVSAVFETPYGYHFLVVKELRPASKTSLPQAQGQITNYLKEQEKSRQAKIFLEKLQSSAKITYFLPEVKEDPAAPPAAPAKP